LSYDPIECAIKAKNAQALKRLLFCRIQKQYSGREDLNLRSSAPKTRLLPCSLMHYIASTARCYL